MLGKHIKFFQAKSMNMAAVTEQTTEAFDKTNWFHGER